MTFQDWVILAGLVLPIVGNLVAYVLRKAGRPALAATVDRVIPLSAQLGMAKSAKDLIVVAHEAAHVITTSEPNSIKLTNEDESVSVRMDLAPKAPDTPNAAPPGSVILGGILFALIAFGCSSVAVVDGAVRTANIAAKGEAIAAPLLDRMCVEPMTALATEPPSPEWRKRFDDLTAHCDPLEHAYHQVHQDREALVDLIVAATSEKGATVADIIAAVDKLTKSAAELAAFVEEMKR